MKKALTVLAVAATLAASLAPAQADNGRIATGVLGGLAAGAILGTMAAQPRYVEPAPVYVAPPPRRRVYVEEPVCHYERGEPVWDDRRGVWFRPRIQVCD